MKTVIINLASEEARWAAVCRQFRAAGLEPLRLEAVSGRDLTPEQVGSLYSEALNRTQYHAPLRPGELGCYASHIAVWRDLLSARDPWVAVFEDDVDIDADLARTLTAIERLPVDWDVIKLIGRRREAPRARMHLAGTRNLISYRRVPGLTSAYVIHRRGAEKLLARRVPFGRPIDVDMRHWWECGLRVFGVAPYPARLAPSSLLSTIEGRRGPAPAHARLRKFLLQVRYSALNWHASNVERWKAARGIGAPPAALQDRPAR
jgi:glycosyl transferase family 25